MSTSRLQQQVSILLGTYLGQHTIRENHRPEWLDGLELDFYIEELRVGIEVQGRQHYEYTPHFHKSYAAFQAQKDRDNRKYALCLRHNVALNYVCSLEQAVALTGCLSDTTISTPRNQQAIMSIINDTLYRNPKTRSWLKKYSRALKDERGARAEKYRLRLINYIRKAHGIR